MNVEAELIIPHDHPALNGHFPGDPITPAVVILDLALAFARQHGLPEAIEILTAKFNSVLRPGVACTLRLTSREDGAVNVSCVGDGVTYLNAVIRCSGTWVSEE